MLPRIAAASDGANATDRRYGAQKRWRRVLRFTASPDEWSGVDLRDT